MPTTLPTPSTPPSPPQRADGETSFWTKCDAFVQYIHDLGLYLAGFVTAMKAGGGLVQHPRIRLQLPEHTKRVAQIVLGQGPIERDPISGLLFQGISVDSHSLFQVF